MAMSAKNSGKKSIVVNKGGNYGWSNREGSHAFGNRPAVDGVSAPIEPVWEYDHQIGKSITGGRVYRSSRVPELERKYLYADYVTGKIWALSYDPATGKATRNEQVIPDSIPVLAFGEDARRARSTTLPTAPAETASTALSGIGRVQGRPRACSAKRSLVIA